VIKLSLISLDLRSATVPLPVCDLPPHSVIRCLLVRSGA